MPSLALLGGDEMGSSFGNLEPASIAYILHSAALAPVALAGKDGGGGSEGPIIVAPELLRLKAVGWNDQQQNSCIGMFLQEELGSRPPKSVAPLSKVLAGNGLGEPAVLVVCWWWATSSSRRKRSYCRRCHRRYLARDAWWWHPT